MIKEIAITAVAVLVALIVYDLAIKKMVVKSSFESADDDDEY